MVLARLYVEKRTQQAREEGLEKGRQEGRQESDAAWEAWIKRRDEAAANGQPFDEPMPSHKK
jgi:hypothetical protein